MKVSDARPEPVLEVRNLSLTFKTEGRETSILEDISFALGDRQTLGIVGESGSGKSVTALSILKLIPSPPLFRMSGEIHFRKKDLAAVSSKEMRSIRGKEIGFIFQEPMTALNPVLTIGDQIMETIRVHERVSRREARDRAVILLKEVGIPAPELRIKSYPHELSGGMRQRAMIAMSLSCGPAVLIADEPTTALDVTIQAQILELFRKLKEERRMSMIFITHDLGVIAEVADEVLVMHGGAVKEYGTVEDIFHAPSHPYTRNLLGLLPGRSRHGGA
jgi:oligopeptide transport system ATP-binding protein